MHTLHALDLTTRSAESRLWRAEKHAHFRDAPAALPAETAPDLPADGFASPFGYWFAAAPSWKAGCAAASRRI